MAKNTNKPEETRGGVSPEDIVEAGTIETTNDVKDSLYKSGMKLVLQDLKVLIGYVNNRGRPYECEKLVRAHNMVEDAYRAAI